MITVLPSMDSVGIGGVIQSWEYSKRVMNIAKLAFCGALQVRNQVSEDEPRGRVQ